MATQLQQDDRVAQRVPLLRAGDRLTSEEFERRHLAMPDVEKAELVEGVVYMPSDGIAQEYGEQCFDLVGWLGVYRAYSRGLRWRVVGRARLAIRCRWAALVDELQTRPTGRT